MVAAHWVEVVAVEAFASGSSDVGLESSVTTSETEGAALALASVAGSSGVAWKLVRRWEARPNIASRGLSREWHLPLAILLQFLFLIFNNNGLVDHVLEVGVVGLEQLELNLIIQPIKEHIMFLLIRVDVVRGISW
jgi:hypothetical protein